MIPATVAAQYAALNIKFVHLDNIALTTEIVLATRKEMLHPAFNTCYQLLKNTFKDETI